MRFDNQLSRMNCHTFSTGFSSGHLGGSGMSEMLWNKLVDQPWRIMSIGLRQWAHGF